MHRSSILRCTQKFTDYKSFIHSMYRMITNTFINIYDTHNRYIRFSWVCRTMTLSSSRRTFIEDTYRYPTALEKSDFRFAQRTVLVLKNCLFIYSFVVPGFDWLLLFYFNFIIVVLLLFITVMNIRVQVSA